MEKALFDDLVQSLKEAIAIKRGELKPSRVFMGPNLRMNIKAVRERLGLSQSEFAAMLRVSIKTLQNWEQQRRNPTGPAAALLKIVSVEPELALRVLQGVKPQPQRAEAGG